jgi:hypothetical protein
VGGDFPRHGSRLGSTFHWHTRSLKNREAERISCRESKTTSSQLRAQAGNTCGNLSRLGSIAGGQHRFRGASTRDARLRRSGKRRDLPGPRCLWPLQALQHPVHPRACAPTRPYLIGTVRPDTFIGCFHLESCLIEVSGFISDFLRREASHRAARSVSPLAGGLRPARLGALCSEPGMI